MNAARKIIGLLIIIFIVLPLMFGIIWTVGITKAAISPDVTQKLPQILINELPDIINNSIEKNYDNHYFDDDSERIIKAIKKTGISIREVLTVSGLSDWLDKELSESLYKIGEVLKGNDSSKIIYLDMKALKTSLTNDYFKDYIKKVFNNLPECDSEEKKEWEDIIKEENYMDDFPVCKYKNMNLINSFIENGLKEIVNKIPDKVKIFERDSDIPIGVNISKLTIELSYVLFIIPIIFMVIASFIADSSKTGFLRWTGYSTIVSGVIPLIVGYILKDLVKIGNNFVNISEYYSGVNRILYEDITHITTSILNYFFTPVIKLSATVVLIGIVIIGFSYVIKDSQKTK